MMLCAFKGERSNILSEDWFLHVRIKYAIKKETSECNGEAWHYPNSIYGAVKIMSI